MDRALSEKEKEIRSKLFGMLEKFCRMKGGMDRGRKQCACVGTSHYCGICDEESCPLLIPALVVYELLKEEENPCSIKLKTEPPKEKKTKKRETKKSGRGIKSPK